MRSGIGINMILTRGYHAYMNIWTSLIGENLACRKEPDNPVDEKAIALIRIDSLGKETVVGPS